MTDQQALSIMAAILLAPRFADNDSDEATQIAFERADELWEKVGRICNDDGWRKASAPPAYLHDTRDIFRRTP